MLSAEISDSQEQAGLRQGDPNTASVGFDASGGDARPRDGGASIENTALKADVQKLKDESNRNKVFAETQY